MSYEFDCSQATKQALEGDVAGMAEEMGCSDKFLYALLAGQKRDVYREFKEKYFRPVARRDEARARNWLRDLQDCLLRFGNKGARVSNESLADQVGESSNLWVAFMTARDKGEPLEKQRALLVQWMETAQVVATSMDREIQKRNLSAVEPPAVSTGT